MLVLFKFFFQAATCYIAVLALAVFFLAVRGLVGTMMDEFGPTITFGVILPATVHAKVYYLEKYKNIN